MFFKPKKVAPVVPEVVRPTETIDYPSWTVVDTEKGVYLINGKTKKRVFSPRCLATWGFSPVFGSVASVSKFKYLGVLGFRNGTLVESMATRKLYFISDNKRRHVVSPDVFTKYGFNPASIVVASEEEINLHEEGEVLS